jgi:hypothetical protein
MLHVLISVLFLLFALSYAVAADWEFRVTSDGGNVPIPCSAKENSCFSKLSLQGAVSYLNSDAWKQLANDDSTSVRIVLNGGVYRLDTPLVITWGNDKTKSGLLTISGPTKGTGRRPAVLSGGKVLSEYAKLKRSKSPSRIPNSARFSVISIHLSETLASLFTPSVARGFGYLIAPRSELFFRQQVMTLARWPNEGYGRISAPSAEINKGSAARAISFDGKSFAGLADEPDMSVLGYFAQDWADEDIPVTAVDLSLNALILKSEPIRGMRVGQRVRLQNALSELDQPGEWFVDRSASILYFWPPAQLAKSDLEISVVDTLLRFESARNVRIEDLILETTRGDAVVLQNSENIILERCIIRNVGNRAVVISGGKNSGLKGSEIDQAGEGGMLLEGGDRKTLTPAGLFVENSSIRRFSRLGRTNRPAVMIAGVGNRVERNVIAEAPHSAIMFSGNDHRIASNDISRVVLETDDAGVIYTGRDWTARGTVIEDNFIHDIGSQIPAKEGVIGIYLDDLASGIVVHAYIFARVSQPVFIGGGRDNVVDGNLFYFSSPAIHLDARGIGWARASTLDPKGTLQKGLASVPYNRQPYLARYPNLSTILEDEPGAPKYNIVRNNLIVGSESFRIETEAESGISLYRNLVEDDKLFLSSMNPAYRALRVRMGLN